MAGKIGDGYRGKHEGKEHEEGRKGFPVKRTCGALLLSTALALGLAGCGDSGNRNGGTNSGTNDSVYDGTNGSVSGSSGTYGGGAYDGTDGVYDKGDSLNDGVLYNGTDGDVRDALDRAGDNARNAVDRAGGRRQGRSAQRRRALTVPPVSCASIPFAPSAASGGRGLV